VAILTVTVALLGSGCKAQIGGPGASGDPGGHRLRELSDDRVFATLPTGATLSGPIIRTPANHKPLLDGGGWSGPTIVVTFTSTTAPTDIFAFYDQQATAAGWKPNGKGALGVTDGWGKTFPDGANASLSLTDYPAAPGTSPRYSLDAGIAPLLH
jgi:hypothetical protein